MNIATQQKPSPNDAQRRTSKSVLIRKTRLTVGQLRKEFVVVNQRDPLHACRFDVLMGIDTLLAEND